MDRLRDGLWEAFAAVMLKRIVLRTDRRRRLHRIRLRFQRWFAPIRSSALTIFKLKFNRVDRLRSGSRRIFLGRELLAPPNLALHIRCERFSFIAAACVFQEIVVRNIAEIGRAHV